MAPVKPHRGAIAGIAVGQMFGKRTFVREAGLHNETQAGISGCEKIGGAYAVIVSGGYNADTDRGDDIYYAGHGQVSEGQKFTRGNRGLASTCDATLNKDGAVALNVFKPVHSHIPNI
jgi:hypothetical protein